MSVGRMAVVSLVVVLVASIGTCVGQSNPVGTSWQSYYSASLAQPWQVRTDVAGVQICDLSQCCCPTKGINTYTLDTDTSSIYFNATFKSTGHKCTNGVGSTDQVVQSDNLNIPYQALNTQEFFGEDTQTLLVQNATAIYNTGSHGPLNLLLTVIDNANSACSYVATKKVASAANLLDPNSNNVCYNNGPCGNNGVCTVAGQVPSCSCNNGWSGATCAISAAEANLAQNWIGTYTASANSGCSSDSACCCLQGPVNIYTSPAGVPALQINGTGLGAGCDSAIEQDDFPYPSTLNPNNTAVVGTSAANLWDTQDSYVVNLSQQGSNWQIALNDQDNTDCSFVLTRPGAGSGSSTNSVISATQLFTMSTPSCWMSNNVVNAQIGFTIAQTDSTSAAQPHAPSQSTGLPTVTITFNGVGSVSVSNSFNVNNGATSGSSWTFTEEANQGSIGGTFIFQSATCTNNVLIPPLKFSVAATLHGVTFPTSTH